MLTLLVKIHNLFRAILRLSLAICLTLFSLAEPQEALADIRVNAPGELGGRIVFTRISPAGEKDLVTANLVTGSVEELFASKALDEYPSWSPDGKTVLFYSDVCGDREIFSIRSDGKKLKRLTKSPGVDEDPDWSPDGKKIVFKSARGSNVSSNIFVMQANGSRVRRLTNLRKDNGVPKWSPQGNEVIFASNKDWPGWDLVIHHMPSKANFPLTTGSKNYSRASWHPSGHSLVFSFGEGSDVGIYSVSKGSNDAEKITEGPGRHFDPVYSYDGEKLLFTKEVTPGKKDYQVFQKMGDPSKPQQITSGSSTVRNISWTSLPDYPFKPEKKEENAGVLDEPTWFFSDMVDDVCGRARRRKPSSTAPELPSTTQAEEAEKPERAVIRNLKDVEVEP